MSAAAWDLALDNFLAHCGAEKGLASASLEAARFDLARLRRWAEGDVIEHGGVPLSEWADDGE